MNKKMREILESKDALSEKASDLLAKARAAATPEEKTGFMAEAKDITNEIKQLNEEYEIEKTLFENEKGEILEHTPEQPQDSYETLFLKGVKNHFKEPFINRDIKNAMTEGTAADGGYTVPQDILTGINELRESRTALQNLVTVEQVLTLTGSRVFQARSAQTGFALVAEGGAIAEKDTPSFSNLTYNIKKYAGYFKMTKELLADTDQALKTTLIKWIGNDSRITRNKLILAELDKKAKTAIADVDALKTAINITLDPDFRHTSKIITNQTGFNWLDTLTDSNGNYLLQPSVTAATGKQLLGLDIELLSNKDLPNDVTAGTKAPIIIGDLKEGIVLFDRQTLEITSSDEALGTFETDQVVFKAIEREEVKTRDAEAFVYGQVAIT